MYYCDIAILLNQSAKNKFCNWTETQIDMFVTC